MKLERDLNPRGAHGNTLVMRRSPAVPSLHDCFGRVRRAKAKPLRGRYASLDTPYTTREMAAIEATGAK